MTATAFLIKKRYALAKRALYQATLLLNEPSNKELLGQLKENNILLAYLNELVKESDDIDRKESSKVNF